MALYTTKIPPKPSRPFTEYHVFFQLERNYILQTSDGESADIDRAHLDGIMDDNDVDPHAAARPPRYRSLILPSGWHTKGTRPKCRSHRKNHGKITFVELSKLISRRWREADGVTRAYCRDLAERELKRYREEMRDYVERYGERAIEHSVKAGKKGGRGQRGGKGKKAEEDGKLMQDAHQGTANENWVQANLAVLVNVALNEKKLVAPAAPVPHDIAMLYPNLFGTGVQKMHAAIAPQVAASTVPGNLAAQYPNLFGSPQQVASHRMTGPASAPKGLAHPLYPHLFSGTAAAAAPPQAKIQVPAAPQALAQLQQQHQMENKLLDLRHELQKSNVQMLFMNKMQLMNSMQSQSQAMKPQPMMNQVMIPQATSPHESMRMQSQAMKPQPTMNQDMIPKATSPQESMQLINSRHFNGQAMEPQPMMDQVMIPQATSPQESKQLINSQHFNGSKNTMVWTTMKDEGPLPALFEDEEYHDLPFNDCYDTCYPTRDSDRASPTNMGYDNRHPPQGKHQPLALLSPQGKHQFDDVLDLFDSHDPPVAQFDDDCSIVGPMGIMPKSPSCTPPPPPAAYPKSSIGSPANNNSIRAKSISPMPEYNIAPEISFLAKNFVNEFSRYLNHDHDVQKPELEALDHQGVEKQALNDMLHNGPQANREGDAPIMGKGSDGSSLMGTSHEYSEPLKNGKAPSCVADGSSLDAFKPRNSATFPPGGSHDFLPRPRNNGLCLPTAAGAHEFSKPPPKRHAAQQPFTYPPPHPGVNKANKNQLFDDYSFTGSNMSRNGSECDFEAWLNDDVLI